MQTELGVIISKLTVPNVIAIISAIAAVVLVVYARGQVKYARRLIEHSSASELTQLSMQQNWTLYDRHKSIPACLPSWNNLTDRGWIWRVIILNHLNLLRLAYEDFNRGFISKKEIGSWILKSQFWFSNIRTESANSDFKLGREMLRQLLRPEEGYSNDFRRWLATNDIISWDLVNDLKSTFNLCVMGLSLAWPRPSGSTPRRHGYYNR